MNTIAKKLLVSLANLDADSYDKVRMPGLE